MDAESIINTIYGLRKNYITRYGIVHYSEFVNELTVLIGNDEYYTLVGSNEGIRCMGMDNQFRKYTSILGMKFKRVNDDSYLGLGVIFE